MSDSRYSVPKYCNNVAFGMKGFMLPKEIRRQSLIGFGTDGHVCLAISIPYCTTCFYRRVCAGDAVLEYISMAFNQDCYLIGLSGVPDFTMTLWNWTKGEKLCSVASGLMVHEFMTKCVFGVLQIKNKLTVHAELYFRIVRHDYHLVQKVTFLLDLPHLKYSWWNLVPECLFGV